MAAAEHDVVIIGGGHNGLVCGAYLAKAGLNVCVLERRDVIGGAAASEAVWPGYRVSVASYMMGAFQPKIVMDLELQSFGFEVLPATPMFQPLADGRSLIFYPDVAKTCAQIAKISVKDAAAYPLYLRTLQKTAMLMRRLMWETPPDIAARSLTDLIGMGRLAWMMRGARDELYVLQDLLTLSAYDYLRRWFESDALIAGMGSYAASFFGCATPKTPGTAWILARGMLRDNSTRVGGTGFMRGGMGTVSEAIVKSSGRWGMQVRLGAEAAAIEVKSGRAHGVVLAGGEIVRARHVVSAANARTTFLKLLDPSDLPAGFVTDIKALRTESLLSKINVALDRRPAFRGFDADAAGFANPSVMRIAPSTAYFEQAFDEAKHGAFSSKPFINLTLPSIADDTVAPPGRHLMTMVVGYTPYALANDSWDNQRGTLLKTVMDTLSAYAPGVGEMVIESQVLTPVDFERLMDLPDGHFHHGEITLDKMFFRRPAAHYADYRTPVAGLYQCGAATHPGGGVSGVPGHNAAREILKDLKLSQGRRPVARTAASA